MKLSADFRDPELARGQLNAIEQIVAGFAGRMTLMEVCGTHTMAIYQHGIRSLLPPQIRLISGPGCPVCVSRRSALSTTLSPWPEDRRL